MRVTGEGSGSWFESLEMSVQQGVCSTKEPPTNANSTTPVALGVAKGSVKLELKNVCCAYLCLFPWNIYIYTP